MRWVIALALIGCGSGDTDAPRGKSSLELSCALQPDNALRVDCEASERVVLSWTDGVRTHDWAPEGTAFTLTGLAAETSYTVQAEAGRLTAAVEVHTGSLPADLPEITVSGTATVPFVFFAVDRTLLAVSTADGRVVWYQEGEGEGDEPMRGRVSGYDWTGDGAVFHITSNLTSVALDGTERFHLRRGVDYERALHHDVRISNDRIWTLNAGVHSTANGDFIYDGLYVFDLEGNPVAEWDQFDHYEGVPEWTGAPQEMWDGVFPGAEEVGHANSVFEAPDGTVVVSLRVDSRVLALEGLDSGRFGEPRWVMHGWGPLGDFTLTADPALTTEVDFRGQHDVRLHGNRLSLFDNRSGPTARTLALELDETAGTAEIVEVHNLFHACVVQGGSWELANGNTLATCATSIDVFEFAAGTPPNTAPLWQMEVHSEVPLMWLARTIPIEEPPPGWVP